MSVLIRYRRLVAFALVLAALFVVLRATGNQPSAAQIREWGHDAGGFGPLVFVPLGVAVSCVFVPFPLIGGAAGALFGVAGGTVVSVLTASLAAVTQMTVTRVVGRTTVAPESRTERFLASRGLLAVFYVRLLPGLPFVALNYAAGATTLRRWHMGLGTAIAGSPRAFAYAALGGSLSNLDRPEAKVAIGVLIFMAVVGLAFARWSAKDARRRAALLATGGPRDGAAPHAAAPVIPAAATETADNRSAL